MNSTLKKISLFTSVVVALFIWATPVLAAADTYTIDPVHSTVIFRVKHLNISYFQGRFNSPNGVLKFNNADDGQNYVECTVNAADVDTANADRDKHIRSPDFLDTNKFETISFKSKQFKQTGTDTFEVSGDLTLHGVTRPLTVQAIKTGEGKGMKGENRIGFTAAFTIQRSLFGMDFLLKGVGDEVELIIALEGIRK